MFAHTRGRESRAVAEHGVRATDDHSSSPRDQDGYCAWDLPAAGNSRADWIALNLAKRCGPSKVASVLLCESREKRRMPRPTSAFNIVYEDAGDGWVYAHVPELRRSWL